MTTVIARAITVAGSIGGEMPAVVWRLLGAPAIVQFGNHGPLALAIIVIGLAVAAADRPNDVRTEVRDSRAGAGYVEDEALSGMPLTEQAGVALLRVDDKTAALLADTGGIDDGREDHQRQRCRQ